MRQNLHTHSTYCDGKNPPEEMVLTAIEKGFDILGFSGHGYVPIDGAAMSIEGTREYIQTILTLKEKYKDRIDIYLGLEEDTLNRLIVKEPFSFVIGSVHFLTREGVSLPIDYNQGIMEFMVNEWYGGSFVNLAKEYYKTVRQMVNWDEVDILGHLDLITKFNEDESFIRFDDPAYVKEACDTIDAFAGKKILEVNTGAISRNYRKTPYPAKNLLRYMHEKGVQICLNSDCHNAEYLDCYFEESLEMIKECGYRSMMKKTPEGFVEEDIDLFE